MIESTADTPRQAPPPVDLAELERPELEGLLAAHGHPRFRASQIFGWLYQRRVLDPAAMTDLPAPLRTSLSATCHMSTPRVVSRERSEDGTEKFLLSLGDEQRVEAVFIPDTPADTFCLSTQVGCAMACAFCLTGKMGLARNLTAGEIVGQVRALVAATGMQTAYNLVFMGMGEPLHNYEATTKAIRMLADPQGLAVPARRMTLSTVGLPSALDRLAQEPVMPNLAVSLHAPTDELRERLVPINRKYPIADVIEACRRFPLKKRARITFEYVLLAGVNDRPADAERLAKVLAGLRAKVNLIPLNAAPGIPFERPSDQAIDRFARALAVRGVTVSVRKSRGRDIRAACGQLLVAGQHKSAGQQLATLIPS